MSRPTLAQMMIEKPFFNRDHPDRKNIELACAWVRERLVPPVTSSVVELRKRAERFVFDGDPQHVASELARVGSVKADVMWQTAHMPAPCVWIEWDSISGDRVGMMLEDDPVKNEIFFVSCIAMENSMGGAAYFAGSIEHLPRAKGDAGAVGSSYWLVDHDRNSKEAATELKIAACDVVRVLFLLTTPRVCDIREVKYDAKLQNARRKRNKPPLIEVKRVNIKIGIGSTRYVREGEAKQSALGVDHAGRRLHPVIGFFRTYTKDRETPRVAWVPEHWRGDPELGMVIHERHIKPSADK